jgi:hypothetical protein
LSGPKHKRRYGSDPRCDELAGAVEAMMGLRGIDDLVILDIRSERAWWCWR